MLDNIVTQYFVEGGWIMWLILPLSLVTFSVVLERVYWWIKERGTRDEAKLDDVFAKLEVGNIVDASTVARQSHDARLRVIYHGLNHHHVSLEGALQMAGAIELKRAGRFIPTLDTIVTLAPLLGLLGTVTGLMRAFFKLGNTELSETAITGGIAEALIATACGLSIAVVALIALNYFSGRLADLQFDLQNAATNTDLLVKNAALARNESSAATNNHHSKGEYDNNRIAAAA